MKTIPHDHYTYRVTWSEEDNEYVGLCAEFPGLSWLAAAPEAALRGVRSVVADVVEDMNTQRVGSEGEHVKGYTEGTAGFR